jgi:hypothetical protein
MSRVAWGVDSLPLSHETYREGKAFCLNGNMHGAPVSLWYEE